MKDLFPEDSLVTRFAHRFATKEFDPTKIRLVLSPLTQLRPKSFAPPPPPQTVITTIEPTTVRSPKRPLPADDSDDSQPASKLPRGASPLKGAAGRRLDQQKRQQQQSGSHDLRGNWSSPLAPPPPSLPRDVLFLLGIIPNAASYQATRFKPEEIIKLLRDTNIPSQSTRIVSRGPPPSNSPYLPPGQLNGKFTSSSSRELYL
jgi:cleavage stimulation factor subunit 3